MLEAPEISRRRRLWYGAAFAGVIFAGLASRHFPGLVPAMLGKYPGDALWALMVYTGWALVFPQASIARVTGLALLTCGVVELIKLYQAPWIVSLRHTTLGYLILGHTFTWQNLIAYTVGVLTGFASETFARSFAGKMSPNR